MVIVKNLFELIYRKVTERKLTRSEALHLIEGLSLRWHTDAEPSLKAPVTLMLRPIWKEETVAKVGDLSPAVPAAFFPAPRLSGEPSLGGGPCSDGSKYAAHIVVLCDLERYAPEKIESQLQGISCVRLQSREIDTGNRYQDISLQLFKTIKKILAQKSSRGRTLIQLLISSQGEKQLFAGLAALLKTARLENPKIMGQLIEVESGEPESTDPKCVNVEGLLKTLQDNSRRPEKVYIRSRSEKRMVCSWEELPAFAEETPLPWKEGGVYLITGGAGKIGLIFAREIASQTKQSRLILTGRSECRGDQKEAIKEIESLGVQVIYRQMDVSDRKAVVNVIEDIRNDFGRLDGIVHGAGVIRDNFILKKTIPEFKDVLAPKVAGTVNLDQATRAVPLDFFVLFSSAAGALGNPGQADYSTANAFMDAYAEYRNTLVASNKGWGQTVSINWPLWKEGGMGVDEETGKIMMEKTGMTAMKTSSGIQSFYQSLASGEPRIMVVEGDQRRLWKELELLKGKSERESCSVKKSLPQVDEKVLREKTLYRLKGLFSEVVKLSEERMDPQEPLEHYGVDSIATNQLNQKLETIFREVSKTLFYEYQTLDAVADFLVKEYPRDCKRWIGIEDTTSSSSNRLLPRVVPEDQCPRLLSFTSHREKADRPAALDPVSRRWDPIAIIGLSGRYPKAENLEEYWENLKSGKTCITEIPRDRWALDGFFHDDPDKAVALRKSYGKWGGFLAGIDRFDPLFFKITPREAGNIDPQERLFLEEAWKALEDAGYDVSELSPEIRARTGVFAGITKQGYNLYNLEHNGGFPSTSFSSLVNRVSYSLDLLGPSIPVDTMCSSALVAIHEACDYIRNGKGELAVVGGVNLYTHPSTYIGLSLGRLLSGTSRSAAFERDGNGFVPGEGVGAIVLKSYGRALKDGDGIYALIRGSAVNHDGKTNGYTTPNPNQQARVIEDALQQGEIDPLTIGYIEAAANGSEVGDAVEMTALTKVFSPRHGGGKGYTIGSVKPIIGHGESVSGMSQITKVILSLQHQTLVPTPVGEALNPAIDFERLPFSLQRDLSDWKSIVMGGLPVPRRAGIMGIGAGGVNAHIILEEYMGALRSPSSLKGEEKPVLFILSAKNLDRLRAYVQKWIVYLKKTPELDLERVAYTLQVGRVSMPCRLALTVGHQEELLHRLEQWYEGHEQTDGCSFGDVSRTTLPATDEVTQTVRTGNLTTIGALWTSGNTIPWQELSSEKKIIRMTQLPTYPFERRRCWADASQEEAPPAYQEPENKAIEFYNLGAEQAVETFREEYLTFCPFEEKIPGFSMSAISLNPEKFPDEWALVKAKQIEMRQVLFCKEDFNRIHTLQDIGCGHGTDVIQIASLYPHIQTHGFTITPAQAELGNRRIAAMGLSDQAKIYHADSSRDPFPISCDLIIGIEVTFHIRNKKGLFRNMASSLHEGGRVLLIDFIANLRGAITDPRVEITIPTREEWIDLLSQARFMIDEIIDVSPQVANFLYDPEFEENILDLPEVARDTLRNYANQSMALEKGWISYCLLKLKRDECSDEAARREHNAYKIKHQTSYADALKEMHEQNRPAPYPKSRSEYDERSLDAEKKGSCKSVPLSPDISSAKRMGTDRVEVKKNLENIFSAVLGLHREDLKSTTFEDLGVGSVNAVALLEAINVHFELTLPTSLVFECPTLDALAGFIEDELKVDSAPLPAETLPAGPPQETARPIENDSLVHENEYTPMIRSNRRSVASPLDHRVANDAVAVIGLSCRCAGANGPDELWEMIREGRDAIREIKDKEWLDYFDRHSATKVPVRYGVMENVDCFDPLFFNISPKEAESMDPAQRILLEESYKALEDAGYPRSRLREELVGTFIGAMGGSPQGGDASHFSMLGAETSILSGRIAYFLDLKGPALAINTACSSSLVAVDLACQGLRNRSIDLAISGGITMYIHPGAFLAMNNAGMLSPTGECRPFDHGANGIVVGDGVGVVILKRLKDAERDGDHIYGVIRGSGTNQDGQTSGITVPSFMSQYQLEEAVYRKSRVSVDDIQYIETHGTATKLGDPIEIHALTRSFRTFTRKKKFCAIGSLKANIGHTAAAAGVLSLIKVVLSLKNKQIAPSINFDKPNEHIDFEESPVFVNKTLMEWPVHAGGSRLAAISSFGFSGTNAHMLIEEWSAIPEGRGTRDAVKTVASEGPYLIVLSAKNEERLKEVINSLIGYVKEIEGSTHNAQCSTLKNIAYTLQVGREAMEERLGLIVISFEDLKEKLGGFIDGRNDVENLYRGQVKRNKESLDILVADQEFQETVDKWIHRGKYQKIMELWVKGLIFDWNKFYGADKPCRISLPTYPFAKERYRGVEKTEGDAPRGAPVALNSEMGKKSHPLVHENTSNVSELRFSSAFTGEEFFLNDHQVKGHKVLPGVAYLEMARAATEAVSGPVAENQPPATGPGLHPDLEGGESGLRHGATGQAGVHLQNVVWGRPLAVGDVPQYVHVGLYPDKNGAIQYEIYTLDAIDEEFIVHSEGVATFTAMEKIPEIDLKALQKTCDQNYLRAEACYETFKAMGLAYGPSQRGVEGIHVGLDQVLVRLALPPCVAGTQEQFVLHPSLMGSILQVAMGMECISCTQVSGFSPQPSISLPFALQSLEIFGSTPARGWTWVRKSGGPSTDLGTRCEGEDKRRAFDVDLCDDQGRVYVRMKGLGIGPVETILPPLNHHQFITPVSVRGKEMAWDGLSYIPKWEEQSDVTFRKEEKPHQVILIVYPASSTQFEKIIRDYYIQEQASTRVIQVQLGDETKHVSGNEWHCDAQNPKGFETCLQTYDGIDCMYFISASQERRISIDRERLDEDRQGHELQLLRLLKFLQHKTLRSASMDCYIVTLDNYQVEGTSANPYDGGITGLAYSIAQGDHRFLVRNIDISVDDLASNDKREVLLKMILNEEPSDRGDVIKFKSGRRYKQAIYKLDWGSYRKKSGLRKRGVYVILGGSGSIGRVVTRYLIKEYEATVVWMGRQPATAPAVQEKIASFHDVGKAPDYIQADATQWASINQAVQKLKKKYTVLHGAIFSGLVFKIENSVSQTTETDFHDIFDIKTKGSINFYAAFQREPLDFMCYFSSGQAFSFSGAANLSSYAAGITFSDSFIQSVQNVSEFPAGIINWGFWKASLEGTSFNSTIDCIESREGFACFERFTCALQEKRLNQVLCLKASEPVQQLMNGHKDEMISICGASWPMRVQPSGTAIDVKHDEVETLLNMHNPDEFDGWMLRLLFAQLRGLGVFSQKNIQQERVLLQRKAGVVTPYNRWWEESLNLLERNGYIQCEARRVKVREEVELEDAEKLWEDWDVRKETYFKDSEKEASLVLVDACLRSLPEILQGTAQATEILFPNSSMERVEGIYKNNMLSDYFNAIVAKVVTAYVKQRIKAEPQAKLRLIEIGAGTGGTTSVVLTELRPFQAHIQEYCYTDISQAFLMHAEEHYGPDCPYLAYRLWDVEQPLADQGIEIGKYDIVLASNVLHATANIRQTLRNAKSALHQHGLIILNEISKKSVFAHLTFALLKGWWRYEDPPLRIAGSPAIYPETWRRVLEEEGFGAIQFPAEAIHTLGQQIIVAESDGVIRQKIIHTCDQKKIKQTHKAIDPADFETTAEALPEYVADLILDALSQSLKISKAQIDRDVPFSDYGMDSILSVSFVDRVSDGLGITMNTAVIFDYTTVNRLSQYVNDIYKDKIKIKAKKTGLIESTEQRGVIFSVKSRELKRMHPRGVHSSPWQQKKMGYHEGNSSASSAIAVIGMSGQFPGARDVDTFWANLLEERDGVCELPASYLDQTKYFSLTPEPEKTYCKWGGILEERACFDPLFFNISPREAESMNPHQRLILQEGWKGLEDAGYNPKTLASVQVGLFIGAEPSGYIHESFTGASEAIIASRLSYFLNLKGPSMVVNTGCSSSAVALHIACESLRNNESSMALAGGVVATMNHTSLIALSQIEMLSPRGRCHTFDESADGSVFSEGVAIVVLKRLNDALADGDSIYGIIQGSGMNQDGASNGITAPNGVSQEDLIVDIYRRYQINPEEISYIEAHGTGTKLGDPVEANALVRAFKKFTDKKHYCALGSAKSHVGHIGACSGVVGLIKILLSLKHHQLPRLLHFKKLNPLIEFEESAFYVNTQLREWRSKNNRPLMAGLNSFGHSGTNVHLLVREYIQDGSVLTMQRSRLSDEPVLIALSAKNEDRLKEMVRNLHRFIVRSRQSERTANRHSPLILADLAYTLQVGREAMNERIVFCVKNGSELIEKLGAFMDGKESIDDCYRGRVEANKRGVHLLAADEDTQEMIAKWVAKGKLKKVAELWSQGITVDWDVLYGEQRPHRLSVPTYPFARERYWVEERDARAERREARAVVHPLLHENTSTLEEQRFSSTFTGEESFLKDYQVKGHIVFPEVAYLEMAWAALEAATSRDSSFRIGASGLRHDAAADVQLKNMVWARPLVVEEGPLCVHIALILKQNGDVHYEIYTDPENGEGGPVVHGRGLAVFALSKDLPARDLEEGKEHRVRLSLPSEFAEDREKFVLHSSLIHSAIQAAMGPTSDEGGPIRPGFLQSLEFFRPCPSDVWAQISNDETTGRLDIDLCDDAGNVCIRMTGLERGKNVEPVMPEDEESFELMTFEEAWQEEALPETSSVQIKVLVCFLSKKEDQRALTEAMKAVAPGTRIIFIGQGRGGGICAENKYSVSNKSRSTYEKAFKHIREYHAEVDAMLYLWPLEDAGCIEDVSPLVQILQTMVLAGLKPKRLLAAGSIEHALDRCYLESWIGFERSIGMVFPQAKMAVVVQDGPGEIQDWAKKLWAELSSDKMESVFYRGEERHVQRIQQVTLKRNEKNPFRAGGTYLITGGCGGLGLLFAEHLSGTYDANLILIGRSALTPAKKKRIQALETMGGSAVYLQADVSDAVAIKKGLESLGPIHGVIHAAGIEGKQSLLEKELEDFERVLSPKIKGTLTLDKALAEEPLDFVCYFSSNSALLGDFGSCDYAVGNRFQMAYADVRDTLRTAGTRRGRTLAVNWPLWKDGGMGTGDEEQTRFYLKSSGQRALEADEGIALLEQVLVQEKTQYLILAGQPNRVHRFLGLSRAVSAPSHVDKTLNRGRRREMKGLSVEECVDWDLKELAGRLLKIDREKLQAETNLADYGFDSISLAEFARLLTKHFGIEVTPALFFGYSTLGKLKGYLISEEREAIQAFYAVTEAPVISVSSSSAPVGSKQKRPGRSRFALNRVGRNADEPIAIIGMSGRFPQARDIKTMWDILSEGKHAVEEIPADRFDWQEVYGDPNVDPHKTNGKWCGAIPGVAEFDPLFFEIPPREAKTMDPRQRHLLQESWKALEDAGYGARQLQNHRVGMFVGVEEGDYGFVGGEGNVTSNHNAILAVRLAYFLDLHGPAMAINTACSSSLVAAHQAILSLRSGECDTAITVGVNMILTSGPYMAMGQAGMLSPDGKCAAFDKKANGMVPGEAVAVLVLKRLSEAESDGDPIHAVILASGVNYDGKTNGITAPNGVSQSELFRNVYDRHRIDPEQLEYIVTHGTGTRLGDPVEINALYNVFKSYTSKQGYCALTSTKSNFGHTFAASGIVSVISLVEALKHKRIPASLHCEEVSDYIQWDKSPFYVNRSNRSWPNQQGKTRMGAVSAFGMSGTNAHMVVEEYAADNATDSGSAPFYVLALSAKTEKALDEKVTAMTAFLEEAEGVESNLTYLSYTLLEGRHHFRYRCAIVIQDIEDAVDTWKQIGRNAKHPNVIQGVVPRDFTPRAAMEEFSGKLLEEGGSSRTTAERYREILYALADLYSQGYEIEWSRLFGDVELRRLHLPTYPFARDRYWVDEEHLTPAVQPVESRALLHPLLHMNTSDISELRFSSRFSGDEDFLTGHLINGRIVLPEVAYLEMARAAMDEVAGISREDGAELHIRNMVWAEPIGMEGDTQDVHIALFLEENQEIVFEIYTERQDGDEESIIHGQGVAAFVVSERDYVLDIPDLQAKINARTLHPDACHKAVRVWGLGPGYQGIEAIHVGRQEGLVKLSLPFRPEAEAANPFVLHPGLMDSAMRAAVACVFHARESENGHRELFFPSALEALTIRGACVPSMWAWIRWPDDSAHGRKALTLDIDLCDERGQVRLCMRGMTCRMEEVSLPGNAGEVARPVSQKESETIKPVMRSSKTSIVSLADPAEISSSHPLKKPSANVLKATDVLTDLKSAMPSDTEGLIPTLNRTGVMTEVLIPSSRLFADYAGQCGGEVLDIGCAYGVATIAALERGARVLAVDMEQQHLSILEERIKDEAKQWLSTQRGKLPDIEFEDGRFCAVHASRVIHFLTPEDVQKTIRKMYRWLQPGGKLFLVTDTPYVGYWASKASDYEARKAAGELWPGYIDDVTKYFDPKETDGAPPLINPLDPDILRRECSAAGFEVEDARFFGGAAMEAEGNGAMPLDRWDHVGAIAVKPLRHTLFEPSLVVRPTETTVLSRDRVSIRYDVQRSGNPVLVFVHGGMCDRGFWRAQIEHFSARLTTVSLDLAGHGESGRDRLQWSIEAFAEDVAAVVHHLDLKQVVLIGHGMGVPVILEAAHLMPERIQGLVGVDLFDVDQEPMPPEQLNDYLAPMQADFVKTMRETAEMMVADGADATLRQRIVTTMSSVPPDIGVAAMNALFAYDFPSRMERLTLPFVLINSSDFEVTNVEAARCHGVEVKFVKGAGHFSMMERPETFNRVLGEVVSRWMKKIIIEGANNEVFCKSE